MSRSGAQASETAPFRARYVTVQRPERIELTDRVELMVVVAGHGCHLNVLDTGGVDEHRIDEGQVIAIGPRDRVILDSKHADGMRAVSVAVPYLDWVEFVLFAGETELLSSEGRRRTIHGERATRRALEVFETALACTARPATRRDLTRFLAAAVDLLASDSPRGGTAIPPWLTSAIADLRVEDNLRAGVPRLAELARVSRAHLADTTRRVLGITPTDLVAAARMRHAQALLVTTDRAIADIALQCGYASAAYFSTVFRERLALTPREYRSRSRRAPQAPVAEQAAADS